MVSKWLDGHFVCLTAAWSGGAGRPRRRGRQTRDQRRGLAPARSRRGPAWRIGHPAHPRNHPGRCPRSVSPGRVVWRWPVLPMRS